MKLWKWWPFFLFLILAPTAYLLNPDAVITPFLTAKGFSNPVKVIISGMAGTIEMTLWYIDWRGVRGLVASWFEEDVNFAKKIAGQIKRDGYVDWVKIHFTRKYKKLTEKADRLVKSLRAGSYIGFFWIGFWPIWGPRVIGDFVCGTFGWRGCFLALCFGNFVKTAYLVFAWGKIFSFFGW